MKAREARFGAEDSPFESRLWLTQGKMDDYGHGGPALGA